MSNKKISAYFKASAILLIVFPLIWLLVGSFSSRVSLQLTQFETGGLILVGLIMYLSKSRWSRMLIFVIAGVLTFSSAHIVLSNILNGSKRLEHGDVLISQGMALAFFVFGLASVLIRFNYTRFVAPVQFILQTLLVVLLFMAGEWAYAIPDDETFLYTSDSSMFGLLLMVIATTACIAELPAVGMATLWKGGRSGNVMARILMAFITILAILLGYLLTRAIDLQAISSDSALLVFGFAILITCFGAITILALHLNRSDHGQEQLAQQHQDTIQELKSRLASSERALTELQKRNQKTNEAAKIGFWHIDFKDHSVEWSPYVRKLFGVSRASVPLLQKALEFNVIPNHQERIRVLVKRARESETHWEEELLIQNSEGQEKWARITCTSRFEGAECAEMQGTIQDIDDRKRAEIKLKEEQQFLQLVVDNIPVNIYVKDLESRKTLVNKAELDLLGISDPSLVIGKNDYDLYPKSSADISREEDLRIINERQVMRGQETCLHLNDGDVRWFLTSKIPLIIEGSVKGILGVSVDITQRKLDEDKLTNYAVLEAKSKEMEELTYVTSHDLREPLLTIKNYTQAMVDDFEEQMTGDAIRYSEAINRGVGRMEELIGGLLDYSRLSRPKAIRPMDMNELLGEVVSDIQAQIESSDAELVCHKLPDEVWGYPVEVKMLFQNLIVNALKFCSPDRKPKVEVGIREIEQQWIYYVSDNGIGIPKESYHQIFVIFRQLHEREKYEGIGIGLAHCKKIVELHNGKIWVDSEPNVGSCFQFSLNV